MKHGTFLQTIRSRALYIECRNCGHGKSTPVEDLLEHMRPDAAVKDVLPRMRCAKCGAKEIGEVRIVEGAAGTPEVVPAVQGGR